MIQDTNFDLQKARQVGRTLKLSVTLDLAEIAALSLDELLHRLGRIWLVPNSKLILDRLVRIDLTAAQKEQTLGVIQSLGSMSSNLSSQDRSVIENAIFRLLRLIPLSISSNYVFECLNHHRATMRRSAYRSYKSNGVDPASLQILLKQYECRRKGSSGQEMLELIARCPEAVDQLDVDYLLQELSVDYWRMRIIESIIQRRKHIPKQLYDQYLIECVWAMVRTGNPGHLTTIRQILSENSNDSECVIWCTWAFGRLGSKNDVEWARVVAEPLIEEAERWEEEHFGER